MISANRAEGCVVIVGANFRPLVPALLANLVAALKDFHFTSTDAAHGFRANWTIGSLRNEGKLCVDVSNGVVNEGVVAVCLLHHAVNDPHPFHFVCAHTVLTVDAGNGPGGRAVRQQKSESDEDRGNSRRYCG